MVMWIEGVKLRTFVVAISLIFLSM